MDAEPQLHVVFLPFMADGHMIPTLDVASLFAARDVKATIITTPLNVPTFTHAIRKVENEGDRAIELEIFEFPAREAGLPQGLENLEQALVAGFLKEFFDAARMVKGQLEEYLEKVRPNCIVADSFFPWATDSAAKFDIPRLVFHGMGLFPLCALEVERLHKPFKSVLSIDEPVRLPLLPHHIKMTRSQVAEEQWTDEDNDFNKRLAMVRLSELKSYGVIVNSFYELEPEYAQFFRKELGRRTWCIGPVSLCNRSINDKAHRGKQSSIECLKWLDSKTPASVIYICFGSTVTSIAPQLHEIGMALENCGQSFIWVVRNGDNNAEWLPNGFEQRIQGRGLIIWGWAPQVLILEHEAVGAFVTHCGWNSTLEGIAAGVPMVTWPHFAEQFYNEKLVTEVLRIGVAVGAKKWSRLPSVEDVIHRDAIKKALIDIMEGKEAAEMREAATKLKKMAWKAIQEGGSSYNDLSALIHELRVYGISKQN